MYRKMAKFLIVAVLLVVLGSIAAVVSADDDKYEESGPFFMEAAAQGDEDTLTFVVEAEAGDKLEIKLDIDTSDGEWELILEGPEGNEVGSMTSVEVDNADDVDDGGNSNDNDSDYDFKYESKGLVVPGEYVFTFTNVGADPAAISGEYKVEVKGDDRYFYDPGARVAIYIFVDVISLWGIGDDGNGYEAIVISFDDIKEKIKKYKHNKGDYDFVFIDWDELDLEENLLLEESEDGKVKLYILTTGEFQINSGPSEDGTVQVFIYDTFPPTRVYRRDFNVYTILREFEALGENEED